MHLKLPQKFKSIVRDRHKIDYPQQIKVHKKHIQHTDLSQYKNQWSWNLTILSDISGVENVIAQKVVHKIVLPDT